MKTHMKTLALAGGIAMLAAMPLSSAQARGNDNNHRSRAPAHATYKYKHKQGHKQGHKHARWHEYGYNAYHKKPVRVVRVVKPVPKKVVYVYEKPAPHHHHYNSDEAIARAIGTLIVELSKN